MPMPINLEIELTDGTKKAYYIPLQMMRGERPLKENESLLKDWAWAYPNYEFSVPFDKERIKKVSIDPDNKMADIDKTNNQL